MARQFITSITLLTAALAVANAQATDPIPRALAGCGLFQERIFCFGGNQGNITVDLATDATMYMLDLSKNATMQDLASNWTLIQPNTNGVNVEPRKSPQFAQISDTEMVFSGGFGGTDGPPQDQTISYNAVTNSWSKYANYAEPPYGNRQIYYGASAFVPGKGLVSYGGFEEHINASWTINTDQNISATSFGDGVSRVVGYVAATYLNIQQQNVWNTPPQTNIPSVFSAFQTSVYSPIDQRIYYLGGTFQDTRIPGYSPNTFANWHPFTYALYFDTATNTWGNQSLGGAIIPSNRRFHSLTIMPHNQTKILLYGGENSQSVVNDFCFTLDLTTFTWKQVSFSVPDDGADLLRSQHNAILLDNSTLLMVFGLTSAGLTTSRPLQFNISSTENILYMSQYIAPPSPISTSENKSTGLGSGAIAGIVVAIVVAVIIAAVIAFIVIRKKRRNNTRQEKKEPEEHQQHLAPSNNSQEAIEVNWDEIEKQYVEIPQPDVVRSVYKPNLAMNDNTDETSTYIVSQSSGSVIDHKKGPSHIAQIPDEGTPKPYLIMKPDGGQQ